jgi:hypothetical protein
VCMARRGQSRRRRRRAGRLAGVAATNDIDALFALRPDACCYNPLWPNIDELVRLLEAGVNVCSGAARITGGKQPPQDRQRIADACRRGESTVFGSGAHPGMTNLAGMVLSAACERVDEIRITESLDCSTYESAATRTAMGFSQDPDTPGLAESVRRESEVFAEAATMMADAIGASLDKMTFDVEFTATHRRHRPGGFRKIPAGTVGGVYGYHRGWAGDKNVISVGACHAAEAAGTRPCHPGVRPPQHAHSDSLSATEGLRRAGFEGLRRDLYRDAGHQCGAGGCGAQPGIATLADLPPITGRAAR